MKRIFLILITLFFAVFPNFAADEDILLDYQKPIENKGGKRIPSVFPSASHDGSIISLFSQLSIPEITIIVKNSQGDMLFQQTSFILQGIPFQFNIGDASNGYYFLEVSYGEITLSGIFEITNK